ncbi:MAG: hypothetical protein ACFE9S_02990 [Candidatus Hermodarchaeota archaeon]
MRKLGNWKKSIKRILIILLILLIFIPFWNIIVSSSIGGTVIFVTFGLYYLSTNYVFNHIVITLFVIYLISIIYRQKIKKKKKFPKLIFLFIILICPQFFLTNHSFPEPKVSQEQWEFSMRTHFNRTFDLFDTFNATSGYRDRQDIYLNDSKDSNHVYAQVSRVYLGLNVTEASIEASLYKIYNLRDTLDFTLNNLLRLIYIDINRSILSPYIRNKVIDAFGKTKYWYTEPIRDKMIYYTENHQILFHTAELLIGQLFPNDTFVISNMTGLEHVNHATPLVKRWLDWRAQFGFAEWHSNTYFTEDIAALVNLVDFSEDPEIVYKAAMVLDIIAFDFANNYYKGRYATTHGRCYDRTKLGTSLGSPPSRDSTSESAWIMLGIGEHNPNDRSNLAAVALATSDHYAPPPILEDIANNATLYNEHKERNSINMDDGDLYNIGYSEDDLMFWLGMSAVLPPQTIKQVFNLVEKYNIDSNNVYGPDLISSFFKISAFLHGISLSQYSEKLKLVTQGISLETSNTYTYRTPFYQLSGSQDHQKGMNSYQEHIWQASLDDDAFVYTNSPGGLTKDLEQEYVGGWNPRATLYKNVGIIQYDRGTLPVEAELMLYFLNLFTGNKFYQHAYFPQWAFDEVEERGNWIFGAKDGGYIALYSFYNTRWASDYELRVDGFKNLWIVELGNVAEYGSFNQFISDIQQSHIQVVPLALGFDVQYSSPSQGLVKVSWDGPMTVGGSEIDLGPYARFDNDYCYQNFGNKTTLIQFGNQSLELNFVSASRIYQIT